MNENVRQLRKLALILDVSGTAIPLSNTKLYQGAFGYVLLQVYVPVTQNRTPGTAPLVTVHRTTIDSAGNRKQFNLDKYNLIYVENTKLNGGEYMIFENPLPKAFTADAGEIEIVINYSEIGENDLGQQVIVSRMTTNIYHAQVAEGGVSDSQTNTDLKGQEVAQLNANTLAIEQMKDDVDNLLLPPDDSDANLEGTAQVEIAEDGRFKFSYLKGGQGEKGDKPAHNWEGTSLQFENPDGTFGEFVDLKGSKGDKGNDGLAVNIIGKILQSIEERPDFGDTAVGDAYLIAAEGTIVDCHMHTAGESDWVVVHNWGGVPGPQGDTGEPGPSNVLSIGTVVSGEEAAATITGTSPAQVLNLTLPKGDKGDTGNTYFYTALYSYDDVNSVHTFTIADATPDESDNISICTKLGQNIAADDDVKVVWADGEWDVKIYDTISGDLIAIETQNPITFTATGGSQSQIFFRTGGKLEIGDITSQDKSSDDNFLACDGSILPTNSENAVRLNELMPPVVYNSYITASSYSRDVFAIMYDGANYTYAQRYDNEMRLYYTSDFSSPTYATSVELAYTSSLAVGQLYSAPYHFFSVHGVLKRSTNLTAWDTKTIWPTTHLARVLFEENNTLIAAGDKGLLSTSTNNGDTFTARDVQFGTSNINGIAYGNGMLMAVGNNRKISV